MENAGTVFLPALPLVYSKTEPFDQSLEDIHRRLQLGQFQKLVRLVRLVDRTWPHHQGLQPQLLQPGCLRGKSNGVCRVAREFLTGFDRWSMTACRMKIRS